MTDRPDDKSKKAEAERKRRLRAKVFGEVLPETTKDESREEDPSNDEWLKRQVPPHHG